MDFAKTEAIIALLQNYNPQVRVISMMNDEVCIENVMIYSTVIIVLIIRDHDDHYYSGGSSEESDEKDICLFSSAFRTTRIYLEIWKYSYSMSDTDLK